MSKPPTTSQDLLNALCRELVRLARREEESAATEAAQTPYWSPCPPTVECHRAAARVLWADVARLETEARGLLPTS
jgi:hypothetical protein